MSKSILIEVAYAAPDKQLIITLQVAADVTIYEAVKQSGIINQFSEINFNELKVGIFGKIRQWQDGVNAGDRIEIYRPLTIDPKEARRARVRKVTRMK